MALGMEDSGRAWDHTDPISNIRLKISCPEKYPGERLGTPVDLHMRVYC